MILSNVPPRTFQHFANAPPRKPRRNKFSRARAKKWFARNHPDLKILHYDGKKTFHIDPRISIRGRVLERSFTVYFGDIKFTTHPEQHESPTR